MVFRSCACGSELSAITVQQHSSFVHHPQSPEHASVSVMAKSLINSSADLTLVSVCQFSVSHAGSSIQRKLTHFSSCWTFVFFTQFEMRSSDGINFVKQGHGLNPTFWVVRFG